MAQAPILPVGQIESSKMPESTLPDFDKLWNYSDPAGTEAQYRAVFDDVQGNADDGYLAELETQIARTLGLQQKFDEAHAQLDKTALRPAAGMGRAKVRYLLERGRVFNSSKKKDVAGPLFIEAWNVGQNIGEDGLAVDAAHMMAIVESGESSLQWNSAALKLAESSEQPAARKWRKSLLNNIGWTYFSAGNYPQALTHFERCRDCSIEMGDTESERIANWSIAKTLRLLGRVDEALAIQKQIETILPEPGGFNCEELGECYLALGSESEAARYFGVAYDLLSQDIWLSRDEPMRLERMRQLSGR